MWQWSLTQADAQWIVAQWLLSSLTQPELLIKEICKNVAAGFELTRL
jgi:hypothetical protein